LGYLLSLALGGIRRCRKFCGARGVGVVEGGGAAGDGEWLGVCVLAELTASIRRFGGKLQDFGVSIPCFREWIEQRGVCQEQMPLGTRLRAPETLDRW